MPEEKTASKLTIVGGAGGLGSTMAFHIGLSGIFDEIVLIDPARNVLATHQIDLRECFVGESPTRVTAGGWMDAFDSDAVVMCAARTGVQVESRNDYLLANLDLIRDTAAKLNRYTPESLLVVATAPLDVYVMIYCEETGWPRNKVFGYSYNDSHRFRWVLGTVLGVDPARTRGIVLGEHGEAQVPVWSSVTVDGEPVSLKDHEQRKAALLLGDWYQSWQSFDSGRTTTWSSATGMLRTLRAVRGLDPGPVMGSVVLEGEYGLSGVALGVPLKPGADGASWEEVIELPLKTEERDALKEAAVKVQALYKEAKDASEAREARLAKEAKEALEAKEDKEAR
jgi:malate/lactate dehydrogenase